MRYIDPAAEPNGNAPCNETSYEKRDRVVKTLLEQPEYLSVAVAVLGIVAGILLSRMGRKRLREQLFSMRRKLERAEKQARDQSRLVGKIQSDQGTLAALARSLPAVVRELNRADLDPRQVPGLIIQLTTAIFEPAQVLFYATRRSANGERRDPVLHLADQRGLTDVPDALQTIPFGEGKIGWVAENRCEMLRENWANPMQTDGVTIKDNHPLVQPEIVGPLLHAGRQGEEVLGVVVIGGVTNRPRDMKLMFQLVTNLGSLALVNSDYRARLTAQANHDGLTGLLNKRHFMQSLSEMIYESDLEAQPVSLFIFDIDHFKNFNDTNGHPAGDALLKSLSKLIQKSVRPGDWVCRYGGEEFIVAMPNTNGVAAMVAAERICSAIEKFKFEFQENQPGGNLTISGGVAEFPRDGADCHELTQNADKALYQSKHAGRNRVTRYRGVSIGDGDTRFDQPVGTRVDGTEGERS